MRYRSGNHLNLTTTLQVLIILVLAVLLLALAQRLTSLFVATRVNRVSDNLPVFGIFYKCSSLAVCHRCHSAMLFVGDSHFQYLYTIKITLYLLELLPACVIICFETQHKHLWSLEYLVHVDS